MQEFHPDGETATVSVVIPVYQGERTLSSVVAELEALTRPTTTPGGLEYVVTEVVLVHDDGPDRSDVVMRDLAARHPFVQVVWLSRNFGQHAATIAGIARATGRWIVTMDEDGQHDPSAIGEFLDTAVAERAGVVYASFTNANPHGAVRSAASRSSKSLLSRVFDTPDARLFQSYRLIRGDMARELAQFARTGVYLDVALSWVTRRVATAPTLLRSDDDRISSYTVGSLFAYFWRMVLTSGTRGLRLVSLLGVALAVVGFAMAVYVVVSLIVGNDAGTEGWASLMVVILICFGAVLLSLGVVAEYIGVALSVAMGRPLYLAVDDPEAAVPTRRRRRTVSGR